MALGRQIPNLESLNIPEALKTAIRRLYQMLYDLRDKVLDIETTVNNLSVGTTLLAFQTASGGNSLEFVYRNATGQSGFLFQTDYDEYLIELTGIVPTNNAANIIMRLSRDGGITWDISNVYDNVESFFFDGTAGANAATLNQTSWPLLSSLTNLTTYKASGSWKLVQPMSSTTHKLLYGTRATYNTGVTNNYLGGQNVAYYKVQGAVNAFRILASAGGFSGSVRVYGYNTGA